MLLEEFEEDFEHPFLVADDRGPYATHALRSIGIAANSRD
jgi:hypothetical protein